jgi:NAD(P)-dependent dehydrogenase (short-subunit alcohol dehydrogenase family)
MRFVRGDLTRPADCRALVRATVRRFGGLDILVNNAASSERSTLKTLTPRLFDRQMHLNVRAPLLLAQAALPHLARRDGVILNIGSVNAYIGEPTLVVYSATKGALATVSRTLAHALAHTRVRVFCLNPGWIDTEGERALMKKIGHKPDFLDRQGRRRPLGRLLLPADLGEICVFLASERARAFSGAVIDLEQFPFGASIDSSDVPHGGKR